MLIVQYDGELSFAARAETLDRIVPILRTQGLRRLLIDFTGAWPSRRPSQGANAPKGIVAVERVARTVATATSSWRAASSASAASRVLPTPAGPAMTNEVPRPPSAGATSRVLARTIPTW